MAKHVTPYERRAIVALMERTQLTDKEIAGIVGRGLWTIFHIRKAAGIPATNKGRAAWVSTPEAEHDAPQDPRTYWTQRDPSVQSSGGVHPYARRAS